ncbi:MAG TPA: leucine-rich repeat domain-containing protein, partial [Gemmataceae bacterium]|nr:leucine-rich repeat domain-containing protein [Gemmataceae bacterium]
VGFKDLVPLKNLTHLDLSDSQITDAGVKDLIRLTQLVALWLGNTRVTDAGIEDLARLTHSSRCGFTEPR